MKFLSLVLALFISLHAGLLTLDTLFSDSNGLFLEGIDPVTYFSDSGPQKGLDKIWMKYEGKVIRFRNVENKRRFREFPEKYTPQFGGYCAYGVRFGLFVRPQLDRYTIEDDKLYLHNSPEIQNRWERRRKRFIAKATIKWKKMQVKKSAKLCD